MKSTSKIIFFYLIIPLIIASIMYKLLPNILNYPPLAIDNDFQRRMDGVTYTGQFLIIILLYALVSMIILFQNVYKINSFLTKLKNELIETERDILLDKITKLCVKTPLKLYIAQILVPLFLIPVILLIIGAEPSVVLKISSIFILFLTLSASTCYVFAQAEFKKIIQDIYENEDAGKNHIFEYKPNINIRGKILLELVPLIMVALFFTSLLSYTLNSRTIGIMQFNNYITILKKQFSETSYSSKEEIMKQLEKLEVLNSGDVKFIIDSSKKYLTYNDSGLSKFIIEYALNYSDGNRTYDYYCIDKEATFLKLYTTDNEFFLVGVSYNTSSMLFINVLIISFITLLTIITIILIYIANSLSKDIRLITNGLNKIINDNNLNHNLIVTSNDETGQLTESFNEIQDLTKKYVQEIHDNQEILVEKERLATLGQMIGGIAHNMKTPIMSVSGAREALQDLAKEYDESIDDPNVTSQDHHEIAKDMYDWLEKIKAHLEYMSDIITAVKGQAVNMSTVAPVDFTISEAIKQVDILMKHELKNALVILNIDCKIDPNTNLYGNINSLVQVINNIISNAIQAYNGEPNKTIDLCVYSEKKYLIISITDYGSGMSKSVQSKLFNSMITTKGKKGTGLGLFMSYSNIKAHFNGNITFKSEENKGTIFYIHLPLK